jgi:hypothetical protein
MAFKTDVRVAGESRAVMEIRGIGQKTDAPALIGMSLRQDIPGGLLSSRARFRFSCQDHSVKKAFRGQAKRTERRGVPSCRVSKVDTAQGWLVGGPPPCSQCSTFCSTCEPSPTRDDPILFLMFPVFLVVEMCGRLGHYAHKDRGRQPRTMGTQGIH